MFKNREFRVKMVNTKKNNEETAPATMEECIGESSARIINDLAKDILKRTAITAVAAIVVIKAVDILGEIAVKKTKSADEK